MKKCLVAIAAFLLVFTACGKRKGAGNFDFLLKSLSTATVARPAGIFGDFLPSPFRAAGDFGASAIGPDALESYQLYVTNIQLCESIVASGAAYSTPLNCTTVFKNEIDDPAFYTYDQASAAAVGTYVDLLSASSRATLRPTLAPAAGTYHVGLITWQKFIKVKGKVTLPNGGAIRTKTCPSSGPCVVTDDMGAGDAEESIANFNNASGTWFKFLKPFVVAGAAPVTVDLAFDLDKKVFAGDTVTNGFIRQDSGCSAVGSGVCGMFAPLLRLSPVPRKSTETTLVEIYELAGPSAEWKLRAEVFYNSADAAKSVLAADLYPVPGTSLASTLAVPLFVYTAEETGGVTEFRAYDGTATLSFPRGEAGSGTLICPGGNTLPGCPSGNSVSVSWTTREVKTLTN